MKKLVLAILIFTKSNFVLANHENFDKVLKSYVNEKNLVAYAKLKFDSKDKNHPLNQFVNYTQSVPVKKYESWNEKEKLAFLINAYNAHTLKLIIDHFPVKSIKDIGTLLTNPWKKDIMSMFAGKITTLDQIEHTWIRPKFKDYRIHSAVNCASKGCPVLRREAYTAEKLDAQLDDQMKLWLHDKSKNRVEKNTVLVSKIFSWYEEDFAGGAKKILMKYAPIEMRKAVMSGAKIEFMPYDWTLNKN